MLRTSSLMLAAGAVLFAAPAQEVTFHKDIEPILQARCQGCHRAGEAAPMALLSYQEARPWAKAIREAVLTRKMPPWFADPAHGSFSNDRRMPKEEIDRIVAWADSGAKEGIRRMRPSRGRLPMAGRWASRTQWWKCRWTFRCRQAGRWTTPISWCRRDSPKTNGWRTWKCGRATHEWCTMSCSR